MAFKAAENIMEMIWENMPKSPDEEHMTLTDGDLEDIWLNGFVDTDKYALDAWIKAFEPHKTPDGTYVLKKEDFLEKDKYRYTGEIMTPFEPLLINEGKYTDEGLQELVDQSIIPSCGKTPKEVTEFFDEFKEKYRKADNLIRVDLSGKREIAELIYQNPSPLRRRELLFDAIFAIKMQEIAKGAYEPVRATPEQVAEVQVSAFTMTQNAGAKAVSELRTIEKSHRAKPAGAAGRKGVPLRKIKRSRKGVRG